MTAEDQVVVAAVIICWTILAGALVGWWIMGGDRS